MAIIVQPSNTPPTPEEMLASMVATHKRMMATKYLDVAAFFASVAAFVWDHKTIKKADGSYFTPQEVFNAYGTDGAELVRLSNAVCAMLAAYTGQPVTVVPEGKALTVSDNGMVTVGNA